MKKTSTILVASLMLLSTVFTSCEAVKNTNKTQRGAAIGAVGGAILGGVLGNTLIVSSIVQPFNSISIQYSPVPVLLISLRVSPVFHK